MLPPATFVPPSCSSFAGLLSVLFLSSFLLLGAFVLVMLVLLLLLLPFARTALAALTNTTVSPEADALPGLYHWASVEYNGFTYLRSVEKEAYVVLYFTGTRLYLTFPRYSTVDAANHSTAANVAVDGYNATIDMSPDGPPALDGSMNGPVSYVWAGLNDTQHEVNFTAGAGDYAVIGGIVVTEGEEDDDTTSAASSATTSSSAFSSTVAFVSPGFSVSATPSTASPSSSTSPSALAASSSPANSPVSLAVGVVFGVVGLLIVLLMLLLWRRRTCAWFGRGNDLTGSGGGGDAPWRGGGGVGASNSKDGLWRKLLRHRRTSGVSSNSMDPEKIVGVHPSFDPDVRGAAPNAPNGLPVYAAENASAHNGVNEATMYASNSTFATVPESTTIDDRRATRTPSYAVKYGEFVARRDAGRESPIARPPRGASLPTRYAPASGADASLPNPWPLDDESSQAHEYIRPAMGRTLRHAHGTVAQPTHSRDPSSMSALSSLSSGLLSSVGGPPSNPPSAYYLHGTSHAGSSTPSRSNTPATSHTGTPTAFSRTATTSPLSHATLDVSHSATACLPSGAAKRSMKLQLVGSPAETPDALTQEDSHLRPYSVAPPAYSPGVAYGILSAAGGACLPALASSTAPPLPSKDASSSARGGTSTVLSTESSGQISRKVPDADNMSMASLDD